MALGTITPNAVNQIGGTTEVFGSLKVTNTDIVGDSSYPTGGTALTAANLGLTQVVFAISTCKVVGTNSPSEAYYDVTNSKLKVFAGAAEMGNGNNLSTSTFQVTAFGY